jgi:hypothetical protein
MTMHILRSYIISYPLFREEKFCCVLSCGFDISECAVGEKKKVQSHCSKGKIRLIIVNETAVSSILRRYFLVEDYY